MGEAPEVRRRWRLFGAAGLLIILAATLRPEPDQTRAAEATPLWCLVCGDHGGVDVINNILLFIPFAFGLRLGGVPRKTVLLVGAASSLAIELLQLTVIAGRDASLSDVLTNSLGTAVGALLADDGSTLLHPSKHRARVLIASAAVLWLSLQGLTAILLRPWLPDGPLRSEWHPDSPGRVPFTGEILSARVAGLGMPDGEVPVQDQLPKRLEGGRLEVELRIASTAPQSKWSSIYQLVGRGGPLLLVESFRGHLIFQPPSRAQALRLRSPRLLIADALSRRLSEIRLVAGERNDTVWGQSAPMDIRAVYPLTPSQSWTLVSPFAYTSGRATRIITVIWIALLLMPLGYWLRRAFPGTGVLGVSALLLISGLAAIPLLFGYPPAHWSEWVGGVVGLSGGCAVGNGGSYFEKRCDSPSIRESC
jgi:VanZ family protein